MKEKYQDKEHEDFVDLFEYPQVWQNSNDGDLSVWKTWDKDFKTYIYHIEIEGFIGYKTLNEGIEYYEELCNALKAFLKKNAIPSKKANNKVIYHSRDVEVHDDKDNDCIWIYVSEPSMGFNSLYDTYSWLSDIIEQLKTIKM